MSKIVSDKEFENVILTMLKHHFSNNAEQDFFIPKSFGKGRISRIMIKKGLEIIISDIELSKKLAINVGKNNHYFELNYCLSGETICEMDGQRYKISEPMGHAYYSQNTKVHLETAANTRTKTLEIRMSPDILLSYFSDTIDKKKIQDMLMNQKGRLKPYPISPVIQRCIFELLQCPYEGAVKKIFFEAKVMELITLFTQEVIFCFEYRKHSIQREDINRLIQARKIVLSCLENPYTLKELSKKVGINEFKLKNGFKQLFGMTVFEFIRAQRMEKAAWLMKEKGHNVSETAVTIGYSNVSNFTVAFRNQFGCNPSEFLKYLREK